MTQEYLFIFFISPHNKNKGLIEVKQLLKISSGIRSRNDANHFATFNTLKPFIF